MHWPHPSCHMSATDPCQDALILQGPPYRWTARQAPEVYSQGKQERTAL